MVRTTADSLPKTDFARLEAPLSGDSHAILMFAQQILQTSTTFYSRIEDQRFTIQAIYKSPDRLDHCQVAAGLETDVKNTLCQFVYRSGLPLTVDDARLAQLFTALPATASLNIRAYVGVPLISQDGTIQGTLCGIDPNARNFSQDQIARLQILGQALMADITRETTLDQLDREHAEAAVSLHDPLLGIGSRRAFDKILLASVARAAHHHTPLSLLFFDIDHLAAINERAGDHVGDACLRLAATRIRRELRASDEIFRFDGDKIVVILPESASEHAAMLAESIRLNLAAPPRADERDLAGASIELPADVAITASVGVATYPRHAACAVDLVHRADAAMYEAKLRGRNQLVVANPQGAHALALPVDHVDDGRLPQTPIVEALLVALETRDGVTGSHAHRVTRLAELVVHDMGYNFEAVRMAGLAARLHDIGKLGIPDAILCKSGPLTTEEWAVMRQHPEIGMRVLQECGGALGALAQVVVAHHERWDGQGYPYGLSGEKIPLAARVIAVVDAFDAMTSDRPYRKAMSFAEAAGELRRHAGSQFDPAVVDALLHLMREDQVIVDAA